MYYCPYCKSTFPDDSHAPCPELVGDTVVKVVDENAPQPARFEAIVRESLFADLLNPPRFRNQAFAGDTSQYVTFFSDTRIPTGSVVEVTVVVKDD